MLTVRLTSKKIAKILSTGRHLETFSLRMRRNGYLGAFSQKTDPAIRFGDLDFLKCGNSSSICHQHRFPKCRPTWCHISTTLFL